MGLKAEGGRVCGYCAFGSCWDCRPVLTDHTADKEYVCHCDHKRMEEGNEDA